ncbi:MAG: hypothetical protein ACR2QR_12535 [Woeseiaceae bacterium]
MNSRRDFLKKVGYAAPAIVSLKAVPSFANTGSSRTETIRPFIDLGPGCSRDSGYGGPGDIEAVRDRISICK